jgi:NTE family protein
MSLPGIFVPVRSDDHIYVDGGLLDNLPVDVAKEMGADITLAIHLQTATLKPDVSLSSFAVLGQSISTVVATNERRSMKLADVVLTVPLQDFDSLEYGRAAVIIEAGYKAAEANSAKLLSLSVDEGTWTQYLAERNARRKQVATPQFVTVTGVPPNIAKPIADDMSWFAGKPVNTASLDQELIDLTGLGPFSTTNYSMVEQNGKEGLQINVENKPYAPPIVRPLIVVDGSDYDSVYFSMGARITFMDIGGYRREWRNDIVVGSQYLFNTEYYRPLTAESNFFVAPRAGFSNSQYALYNENTLVSLYRDRLAIGGLDFGYAFGRISELRLGYEGGYQHLSPQVGPQELPTVSGATGDARVQLTVNTLDNQTVPRNGEHIQFYTKYFNVNPGAPHEFTVSELQVQNFFRLSVPSTVFLHAYGGTSFGEKTGVPQFPLGGVTRFAAYGTNSLLTDQYFLFQAGYIRELKTINALVGSSVNFLAMVEGGKAYQLSGGPKLPNIPGDIVGAIVVNTLIGPAELGGAFGNYGHGKVFFQIGRIF